MSTQSMNSSMAVNAVPFRLLDLPEELQHTIFEFAATNAPMVTYSTRFWRLDPEHASLQQKGLVMIFRASSDLLVSVEYLKNAARAYGKIHSVDVYVVPANTNFVRQDLEVVKRQNKQGKALEEILNYAHILTVSESFYTLTNANLESLRQICPRVNDIEVYLESEKQLIWELRPDNSRRVRVFNEEERRCPPPPTLFNLDLTQASSFENNQYHGISFNTLYDCLFVSRPRSDGPGLSCTATNWPESRSLYVAMWCYADSRRAEVKVRMNLKTNRVMWTGLTYR